MIESIHNLTIVIYIVGFVISPGIHIFYMLSQLFIWISFTLIKLKKYFDFDNIKLVIDRQSKLVLLYMHIGCYDAQHQSSCSKYNLLLRWTKIKYAFLSSGKIIFVLQQRTDKFVHKWIKMYKYMHCVLYEVGNFFLLLKAT